MTEGQQEVEDDAVKASRDYAYKNSEDYRRSLELLKTLGERTDMERVLIRVDSDDICLSEQTEEVGENDWGFIIEVTETLGVKVSHVLERYGFMSHMTEDYSLTWTEVLEFCEERNANGD